MWNTAHSGVYYKMTVNIITGIVSTVQFSGLKWEKAQNLSVSGL